MSLLDKLTKPPVPPQPGQSRPVFSAAGFAFIAWWHDVHAVQLDTFVDDVNDVLESISNSKNEVALLEYSANTKANMARSYSEQAEASATLASDKAGEATAASNSAALSAANTATMLWKKFGISPVAADPVFQWRPGQMDLPAIATIVRATKGSNIDESRTLVYTDVNTVRTDVNPVTGENKGASIEGPTTNLLNNSERFAYWLLSNFNVSQDIDISPDGTVTMSKIMETTASGEHSMTSSIVSVVNGVYTASLYAKAGERTKFSILLSDYVTSVVTGAFDLSTGTCSVTNMSPWSDVSATMEYMGSGVYRCVLTATRAQGTSGSMTIRIHDAANATTYAGNGYSGLYIGMSQLEANAWANSYTPSTSAFSSRAGSASFVGSNGLIQSAATNIVRYNYNPANLRILPKLLLESESTNLFLNSEDFSLWAGSATVTSNAVVAPDGTTTGDKLVATVHSQSKYQDVAVATSGVYVYSVFIKKTVAATKFPCIYANFTGGTSIFKGCILNTNLGLAQTIGTASGNVHIHDYGKWWRVVIVAMNNGTGNTLLKCLIVDSFSSDGIVEDAAAANGETHAWGAQLEAGYSVTSYIRTTTAAVTRPADVWSNAESTRAADAITVPTKLMKLNRNQGTIFAAVTPKTIASGIRYIASIRSDSSHILVRLNQASVEAGITYGGTIPVLLAHSGVTIGTTYRIAFSWKKDSFTLCVNGTLYHDTLGEVPGFFEYMEIGSSYGAQFLNSYLLDFDVFSVFMSDADLQKLTS